MDFGSTQSFKARFLNENRIFSSLFTVGTILALLNG